MREAFNPDFPSGRCSMTGHNVAEGSSVQPKERRDRPPEISRAAGRPPGIAQSRGAARALRESSPIGAGDIPGQPLRRRSPGRHHIATGGVVRRDGPSPRPAVTHVAQRSLPHVRRDTPRPGWESGVWVRIQRRRRYRRVAFLVIAVAAACAGALVARRGARDASSPIGLHVTLESPGRADGSAPPDARWRLTYQGAELRVYRNALGVVLGCPGHPACSTNASGGSATLAPEGPGEYRALVFSRPQPGGGRTLQEDLRAARARGDQVELSRSMVVY
jgi:hypothetical protein